MLLYKANGKLYVGGLARVTLKYSLENDPIQPPPKSLHVRIKNTETQFLKLGYLHGPYTLYVSARSASFDPQRGLRPGEMMPVYDPHLKAGAVWHAELPIGEDGPNEFVIEVVSQVVFTTTANVTFDVTIGRDEESSRIGSEETGVFSKAVSVLSQSEKELWLEPRLMHSGTHLIILTHGLHSNTPADLLYLKEAIVASSPSPVIIRGSTNNVCKTERGVKYLGKRLAKYIIEVIQEDKLNRIDKISFVGHSLGGVVNVYALAWIQAHHDNFFTRIRPVNFIGLASPFLGISSENPLYVKFALDFGVVGKTGQDLSLMPPKPLLRLLPNGPARTVLRMFSKRTVYANVVNDGIVPLRTSCLLYLDWRGLGNVEKAKRENPWSWGSPKLTPDSRKGSPVSALPNQQLSANETSSLSQVTSSATTYEPDSVADGAPDPDALSDAASKAEQPLGNAIRPHNFGNDEFVTPSDAIDKQMPKLHINTSTAPRPASSHSPWWSSTFGIRRPKSPANDDHGSNDSPNHETTQAIDKVEASNANAGKAEEAPEEGGSTSNSGPLSSIMTLLRPHAGKVTKPKLSRIYTRSQTIGDEDGDMTVPPKTTVWESASDLLNPPLPSDDFITEPSARPKCIFHDRIYHPEDVPDPTNPPRHKSEDSTKKAKQRMEEKIARAYHDGMSWRKVLVRLEPDAHNNIIVRRMFPNAYGWDVVAHVVQNHFAPGVQWQGSPDSERPNTGSSQSDSYDSARWDDVAFFVSEDERD